MNYIGAMITLPPKFITVEGVRIAYFEVNPDSEETIFFIHGNSSSSHIWRTQLETDLFSRYRLIAVDLPAHGQSSCFHDYSLPVLGRIVSAVISELAAGRDYMVAGLSLGTNVLAEALGHSLKPNGIVLIGSCAIGGSCTMEVVFLPGIDIHAAFTDDISEDELQQYWCLAGISGPEDEKYPLFAEDYYATQDNFRSKMFATVMAGNLSNEIDLLQLSGIPVLAIFGGEEKVCNMDYLDNAGPGLWQERVFKIPGAGHLANIDQPGKINELILEYARDRFEQGH